MPKSFKIFLITLILFIPFGYSGAQDFQCAPDQFFDFIMIEEEDGVRLVSPSRSDQIMVKAKSVTDIARKLTYPNPSIDCKELLKAKSCLSELKFYKAWASLTYLDSNLKGGMSPYQSGGLLEFYEDFHFYLAKDPNSELFKTALTKNVKKLTADYIKEDQENFINGFISGCKENNLKYYMLD